MDVKIEFKGEDDLQSLRIDLKQLEQELKAHLPGLDALSLSVLGGKNVTLTLHGDASLEQIDKASLKALLRQHKAPPTWRERLASCKTLEERVGILEEVLLGAKSLQA